MVLREFTQVQATLIPSTGTMTTLRCLIGWGLRRGAPWAFCRAESVRKIITETAISARCLSCLLEQAVVVVGRH